MQKTKIGVSVGLLGAVAYFMGLFSGYLVVVLLAGYVLLFEENEWLKKTVVKSVSLLVFFSFIVVIINLIPDTISFINYVVSIFGGSFYIGFISNLINAVTSAINIFEKILFIGLGVKALNQGTIVVPVVDNLINKYTK